VNKIALGLLMSLAVAATACSTAALGSAPAKDPASIYVVGMKAGFMSASPAIWLCPSQPGKGECKRVEVEEVSK
jgi:hypothetical protein